MASPYTYIRQTVCKQSRTSFDPFYVKVSFNRSRYLVSRRREVCGTLKCGNAAICEKVAKCEKKSTLNVKIDAICEKITLNVKKWGSLNVSNISTLNVLKSTLYVQTLFWRYLWKSNFSACQISER